MDIVANFAELYVIAILSIVLSLTTILIVIALVVSLAKTKSQLRMLQLRFNRAVNPPPPPVYSSRNVVPIQKRRRSRND